METFSAYVWRYLQEDEERSPTTSTTPSTIDRVTTILSNILLFLLIFGLSATVNIKELRQQVRNYRGWLTGTLLQFVVMPLAGFCSVKIFNLDISTGITLLTVTSSPGGTLSNWWCATFNADLALSVTLTAISSFLAIGMLPLNLLIYTRAAYGDIDDTVAALDFGALFLSLGIIIAAILSGTAAGYRWGTPKFRRNSYHLASATGLVLIVIAFVLSSQGSDAENTKLWNQPINTYIATALPCLIGMLTANLITCFVVKLRPPERVTVAIECCYQNALIAITVAINMFSDKDVRARAVAVPLFYGLVAGAFTLIYCLIVWKAGWTNAPASDNLWVVVTKLYDVEGNSEEGSRHNDAPEADFQSAEDEKATEQDTEVGNNDDQGDHGSGSGDERMKDESKDTGRPDDAPDSAQRTESGKASGHSAQVDNNDDDDAVHKVKHEHSE